MGFARRMRKSMTASSGMFGSALNDPVFMKAAEFDEGAATLGEGEARICRMDSSPLDWVRKVSYSRWRGEQVQLVCPLCTAKYVQFVPEA